MKGKQDSNKVKENFEAEIVEEDFIPYACHLNEETLITKNSHLMQIIKIEDTVKIENHLGKGEKTIRDFIRDAIKASIQTDDFAFWIHTIRRTANLEKDFTTTHEKLIELNKKWNKYNAFENQFRNEVYVTIIIKGVEFKITDVIKKYFTHAKLKEAFQGNINQKLEMLTQATSSIISYLHNYSVKKLSLYKKEETFVSEMLSFLNKIINLTDQEIILDEADASNLLAQSELAVGFNKMTVKNAVANHTISVLTLKQYVDVNCDLISHLISLPFEFIIYQAFDYINTNEASQKFAVQYQALKVSKDVKMMNALKVSNEDLENLSTEEKLKYGESQISIIIIANDEKDIESETGSFVNIIAKAGFSVIREDVNIEDGFFAAYPANFSFLRRMQPTKTSAIAGFSSIDGLPIGRAKNNEWGDAVCIFKSAAGLPFYFNFHDSSKSGHTIFVGKNFDIQQNAICNFLLMQSLKFDPQIITIDRSKRGRTFGYFMQAKLIHFGLHKERNNLNINPFSAFKLGEEAGLAFCKSFFELCLQLDGMQNATTTKYLEEKLMPFLKKHHNEIKTLNDFIGFIKNEKIINTFFQYMVKDGAIGHLFDNGIDDALEDDSKFISINISEAENSDSALSFFFEYFTKVILAKCKVDKKRRIIKFEGFLEIVCEFNINRKNILTLLEELRDNNCILISLENYSFIENYTFTKEDEAIFNIISTVIFTAPFVNYGVAEASVTSGYVNNVGNIFKLTPAEKEMLMDSAFKEKYFTLKHAGKMDVFEFSYDFSTVFYVFLASKGIETSMLEKLKNAKTFNDVILEAEAICSKILN